MPDRGQDGLISNERIYTRQAEVNACDSSASSNAWASQRFLHLSVFSLIYISCLILALFRGQSATKVIV